ncbi:MAG: transposase [Pseudomonadota bacterium]
MLLAPLGREWDGLITPRIKRLYRLAEQIPHRSNALPHHRHSAIQRRSLRTCWVHSDEQKWVRFCERRGQDWVVYAKQPLGGPAQVLEYLSRYTHRVAISNERILGITHDTVALRVRVRGESSKRRTLRVAGSAFIERFLQHVLPRGFKRIRHYGLLGPAHKAAHLAAARAALNAPAPQPKLIESITAFMQRVVRIEWSTCPYCQAGRFVVAQVLAPLRYRALSRGPP